MTVGRVVNRIKERVRLEPAFVEVWGRWRSRQVVAGYRALRERYAKEASARGIRYRESDVPAAVARRLRDRGCSPATRSRGEVHTFGFVPSLSWHPQLLAALRTFGPVTNFDYLQHGTTLEELRENPQARRSLDSPLIEALRRAHEQRPVDWCFIYATGSELSAAAVRRIRDEFGVPTVCMCLDDKQSFVGRRHGEQWSGQISLAPAVDLCWTSSPVATEWYMAEGGCPIYLPEGCSPELFRSRRAAKKTDVVFVGGAYGFRPVIIEYLRFHGLSVLAHGPGWPDGTVPDDGIATVFDTARVILGMGGVAHAENLTTVKGRDFDAAAHGGAPYLTSYNPDLARHFHIGEEVLCYATRDEMVELARRCVADPEWAEKIAAAGRTRCLAEHTWPHRFQRVLSVLGILDAGSLGGA
ncbi:MAG: glycosyltransferase [Deltaproteobacteria bacterium]|nr:glycosyltransferase [Deltaproteobacteria bacterium]